MKDKSQNIFNKDIKFSNKLNNSKKHSFFNDLSVLISAGVNIRDSVNILKIETKDKNVKAIYNSILKDLISGISLSDSIIKTKKFSKYEEFSIKTGEETGRLDFALQNLSDFLKERIELKRKITSALSYPIIVLLTAIMAIAFMMVFVVPMFEDVFSRLNQDLPPLTKAIIELSRNIDRYFLILSIIIIALIIINRIFKSNETYGYYKGILILKLPFIGDFTKSINISRFCTTLELFLSSGLSVINALDIMHEMINFIPLKIIIRKLKNDIMQGKQFDEAISEHSFFDNRISILVKVGMEVNKLEQMFAEIKEIYNERINHRTTVLNNVLEPIMIVFIGVTVALILVSMYLPIFQISTSFGI